MSDTPAYLDRDELLRDLTPEQQAAVTTVDGPLLVIAAAGSGKTRVLTRRVAYLMSVGVEPGAICAITFTNKAAGEMKERVGKLMGRHLRDWGRLEGHQPTICTFHSLCMRILRHYGPRVGLPGLTIYDTADQTKLIKEALKLLDLSSTNFPAAAVLGTISKAKNELMGPDQFRANAGDFYQRQVSRVYDKYQALLEANGAMDFDDLLLRTVRAFKEHPDVLAELQERFRYILIDEYQDTNQAQYVLSAALAMKHKNLCVVGDPDQSIYAWRGADIQNILDFKKDYPDATEVKLETNYRSTQTILAVADKLIKNNSRRLDKRLITDNPEGAKVRMVQCQDEHDEAEVVLRAFKREHEAGKRWGQMAVFYRMNSLSRVMEDALRRAGVPYVMARGTAFYDRREIKDVLAYLRVIANENDAVSLDRIANTPPRGISDESMRKLSAYATAHGISLFAAMRQVQHVQGLTTRAAASVAKLVAQFDAWKRMAPLSPPGTTPVAEQVQPPTAEDDGWVPTAPEEEVEGGAFSEHGEEMEIELPSEAPAVGRSDGETGEDQGGRKASAASAAASHGGRGADEVSGAGEISAEDDLFSAAGLAGVFSAPRASPVPPAPKKTRAKKQKAASFEEVAEVPAPVVAAPAEVAGSGVRGSVKALMEAIVKQSGLEAMYAKESRTGADSGEGPMANVNELITDATEFEAENPTGTLEEYLTKTALVADVDAIKSEGDQGGAVTMMTLHAAKGLEFPVVAMIGLEEGILPHSRARGNMDELEEERRLCFVGITRAQEVLVMTKAAHRTIRGLRERTVTSPFLGELPTDRVEVEDRTGMGISSGVTRTSPLPAVTDAGEGARTVLGKTYRVGMLVRHQSFGLGRIAEISGTGQQTRCVIDFSTGGRKTLILEYARLETVQ